MLLDCELFQSGRWEQASLCEHLVLFPVILPGGSSPDLVSSYACADGYFPNFSRGPLHSAVIYAVLSSVVLCPMDSCQAGLPELSSLSFQFRESAGLWLTLVPRLDLGNSFKGSFHLFPIFRDLYPLLPDIQRTENHFPIYFVIFVLSCSGQEGKYGPCHSILVGSGCPPCLIFAVT